ncbi:MAG: hypothetical protein AABW50_01660 [Nanoarchaeota archaeon]
MKSLYNGEGGKFLEIADSDGGRDIYDSYVMKVNEYFSTGNDSDVFEINSLDKEGLAALTLRLNDQDRKYNIRDILVLDARSGTLTYSVHITTMEAKSSNA